MKKIIALILILSLSIIGFSDNTTNITASNSLNDTDISSLPVSLKAEKLILASTPKTEIIPASPARNILNGNENNIADVKKFGALGDGKANDTASINSAIASLSKSGGYLYFGSGNFLVSESVVIPQNIILAINSAAIITVGNNALLTVSSSDTSYLPAKTVFVLNGGKIDLSAATAVYPEWFGAIISDSIDDTTAIQTAINSGTKIYFSKGIYNLDSEIIIPEGKNIELIGSGHDITKIKLSSKVKRNGFSYKGTGKSKTTLTVTHFSFDCQTNYGNIITLFSFKGTKNVSNSQLIIKACYTLYVSAVVDLEYVEGCVFEDIWAQANENVFVFGAGTNNTTAVRILAAALSGYFLKADGLKSDGSLSSGIFFTNACSVYSQKHLSVKNFTNVNLISGGFDSGYGSNPTTLLFENVSGLNFEGNFATSTHDSLMTLNNCDNCFIGGNDFHSGKNGIIINGVSSSISKDKPIIINGNMFLKTATTAIDAKNAKYLNITGNFFIDNLSADTINLKASGCSSSKLNSNICNITSSADAFLTASGFTRSGNIINTSETATYTSNGYTGVSTFTELPFYDYGSTNSGAVYPMPKGLYVEASTGSWFGNVGALYINKLTVNGLKTSLTIKRDSYNLNDTPRRFTISLSKEKPTAMGNSYGSVNTDALSLSFIIKMDGLYLIAKLPTGITANKTSFRVESSSTKTEYNLSIEFKASGSNTVLVINGSDILTINGINTAIGSNAYLAFTSQAYGSAGITGIIKTVNGNAIV